MEEILSGTFDKNQIQIHKIPFYNELCCTHPLINKIGAPISIAAYYKYWTNMKENTVFSPSGRHVGIYKATVTSLEDPDATKNQKSFASMILYITNCATQMCIMLEHWKEATDIMLHKKYSAFNIYKLRWIWLLQGDKNFALKDEARTAMKEWENIKRGFSEMQFGFRKEKKTYQATLTVHCVACVHVMMIWMQRKMIATLTCSCQTNLAGKSYEMRRY